MQTSSALSTSCCNEKPRPSNPSLFVPYVAFPWSCATTTVVMPHPLNITALYLPSSHSLQPN